MTRTMPQKYRVIILGAGFSRPAGYPLASELWAEIRERAAMFSPKHRAHKFSADLEHYIAFRREADGVELSPETVEFEDFMRFLDIEHYLGLRGSDTWSADGNEGTIVTKFLIGDILARHSKAEVPELYNEFAKRLQPRDIVITFNYDTLLERALDHVGKPYRLFATRFKEINGSGGTVDSGDEEVVVLKPHGSIDWFDRSSFERRTANSKRLNAPPPEDIIFSHEATLGLKQLVDGPRFCADPLKSIYRALNLSNTYTKDILFLATPCILPPSSAKLLYANRLHDFWDDMGKAGYFNFGMAIVGFSLPSQDEYARQILYELVTTYQRYRWREGDFGLKKSPLAVIDLFSSEADQARYRDRFRFVDWSKTYLSGEGFNTASLDKIFD